MQYMSFKILVVMSTYNGEKYLSEQVESILSQKDVNLTLVIRDDGSRDNTVNIIKRFAENDERVVPIYGNNIGFRKSFFNTLKEAFTEEYDYYAFSDQDDVWVPEKLVTAINALEKIEGTNKLYASSLNVVDQDLKPMYTNSFDKLRISYGSALSRQRLAGCTMVFDKEVAKLCCRFDLDKYPDKLISHDGAVYYVCLACGGKVYFDKTSYINFRRHVGTVTEHGQGFKKRLQSITNIFGEYKNIRFDQNKAILENYKNEMPDDIKDLAMRITSYKNSLKNRFSLALDKRIKCNIKSIDFIYFFAIISGCY